MRLKIGEIIECYEKKYVINSLIGEGGQGEVYLISDGVNNYAFKYYLENQSNDFMYNLKHNIDKGAPSHSFVWPKEFIEFEDGSCGYIMDLLPKEYVSFVSYLNGNVTFKDQITLITWCIELCLAFKKLHEMGYSYQDLNDGSFFLNPNTGALLICDNDNVTGDKKNLGILGKMRYMAPEIVNGNNLPDIHSDRFSLSIILFLTLCLGNPFEGELLKKYDFINDNAEKEMFGSNPIYIMHKENKSNRPIRGYHTAVIKRWPHLPIYIKDAFHKIFVDGIIDRENGRLTEIEWIRLLTKYRDELILCECKKSFIYGFEEKNNNKCPYCNKPRKKICYLQIGKKYIILEPNKNIYQYHIDKYSSEYNKIVGTVICNKKNPSIWGIKLNISNDVTIRDQNGNTKVISNKGVIPIINKLLIEFNKECVGKIGVK